MENKIECKKCGTIDNYTAYKQGPHVGAMCNNCKSFVKWLPQNNPVTIHFGKYKGRELVSMTSKEEIDYLVWSLEQRWMKNNLANKIKNHLNNIENGL